METFRFFYFVQIGNVFMSISKTVVPIKYTAMMTIATPMKLRMMPVLTICGTLILPLPNTTAFGGVATGSINAIDAESVAVIISRSGFISSATEIDASMGNIISVVAVLEIHIERNAEATIKPNMIRCGLPPIMSIIFNAILLCKFHRCIVSAMRKPPMNRKIVLLM